MRRLVALRRILRRLIERLQYSLGKSGMVRVPLGSIRSIHHPTITTSLSVLIWIFGSNFNKRSGRQLLCCSLVAE